jgi:hypothetical protein
MDNGEKPAMEYIDGTSVKQSGHGEFTTANVGKPRVWMNSCQSPFTTMHTALKPSLVFAKT